MFLSDQRLEPTPANYAFAYALMLEPDGGLARVVAPMIDGGVRLRPADVEALEYLLGSRIPPASEPAADQPRLVALCDSHAPIDEALGRVHWRADSFLYVVRAGVVIG